LLRLVRRPLVLRLDVRLRLPVLFRPPAERLRLLAPRRGGTFAPFSLASLSPIAIACFRLFTVRPDPLFNVPRLRRCIADFTFFDADLPYFAMTLSLFVYAAGRASVAPPSGAAGLESVPQQ
jgi:hypothetical protein